jgi:DNA-binding NtrC family response regulator
MSKNSTTRNWNRPFIQVWLDSAIVWAHAFLGSTVRKESFMNDPCSNLPEAVRSDQTVAVLAVSPSDDDLNNLSGIFRQTRWNIHGVHACREARDFLRKNPAAVVVCERRLPDGTWLDLHRLAGSLSAPPKIIVTSDDADDSLWAEVLNLGGYDVLAKPFDRSEVTRIISLAWLHWKESPRKTPASASRQSRAAANG